MDNYTELQLKEALEKFFNEAELSELCFELGQSYENFAGSTKPMKALEIATWSGRVGRKDQLARLILKKRPHAFSAQPASAEATGLPVADGDSSGGTTIHVHGDIVGSVVGEGGTVVAQNIAGRDIQVQQPANRDDFKAQLDELQQLVQEAIAAGEITSEREQEYVKQDLQEAVDAANDSNPDKRRLSRRLEDVKETLEKATEAVKAGGKVATAVAKAAALAATLYQSVRGLF